METSILKKRKLLPKPCINKGILVSIRHKQKLLSNTFSQWL